MSYEINFGREGIGPESVAHSFSLSVSDLVTRPGVDGREEALLLMNRGASKQRGVPVYGPMGGTCDLTVEDATVLLDTHFGQGNHSFEDGIKEDGRVDLRIALQEGRSVQEIARFLSGLITANAELQDPTREIVEELQKEATQIPGIHIAESVPHAFQEVRLNVNDHHKGAERGLRVYSFGVVKVALSELGGNAQELLMQEHLNADGQPKTKWVALDDIRSHRDAIRTKSFEAILPNGMSVGNITDHTAFLVPQVR